MNALVNIFSNSKILLIGLVVAIFIGQSLYIKYISSELENTEQREKKAKEEKESLQLAFDTAVPEYERQLDFERSKAVFVSKTLKEKEKVLKATSKVKEEVVKRGEIKDEENSNFTITSF